MARSPDAARVLVTGITGFLGSHLGRRLLSDGYEVHAIARPGADTTLVADYAGQVRWIEADLADPERYRPALADAPPARAFHLAWYAEHGHFWNSPRNLACVAETLALAQVLVDLGCGHLLVTGTCAEYAWDHGVLSEAQTPTEPASLYGVAKNATREILESYCGASDTELAWARVFFPYGPGEPATRLIPSVTRALLRGERARCTHGRQVRDFVFVEDCAEALCAVSERGLGGPINVGTGEQTRIQTVVETLARLTGHSTDALEIGALEAGPDDPPVVVADAKRLLSEADWRPAHSLEAGLAEAVAWWKRLAEEGG